LQYKIFLRLFWALIIHGICWPCLPRRQAYCVQIHYSVSLCLSWFWPLVRASPPMLCMSLWIIKLNV
jgi:hypothetical protein